MLAGFGLREADLNRHKKRFSSMCVDGDRSCKHVVQALLLVLQWLVEMTSIQTTALVEPLTRKVCVSAKTFREQRVKSFPVHRQTRWSFARLSCVQHRTMYM